jgi:hypothetical protein
MLSLMLSILLGFRELIIEDDALAVIIKCVLYLHVLVYVIRLYSCGSEEWVMSL